MTSYRAKLQITLAMTLALSGHIACSSATNDTPAGSSGSSGSSGGDVSTCTVAGRLGKSECQADAPPGFPKKAAITCSAGTFCVTSSAYEAKCQGGCSSDENCGPSERCVRCNNSAAGSCRACNLSDADACAEKPKADAGPATCTRDTFFDSDCVTPGKAFSCPSTVEPTGQGTCAQTQTPGIWCCGGAVATCKRDTVFDQSECGHPGPTGPRPPKGYTCDSGSEPPDPKCVQGDLPIHWCCPK